MTRYARDEFDRVPQNPARQGVHRAPAETPRRSLLPILMTGMAALVVGLVCFLVLPKLGFTQAGSEASVMAENRQGGAAPASSDSTTATPSTSATAPGTASPEPTSSSSASPTTTASHPVVDKTAVVSVYNGTTTGGLAARVASQVQGDGWPLGVVGNWGGTPQATSVIFYRGEAQKANAEALSQLLGIATLVNSTDFQQPLVVLVGPGYR